MSVYLSPGVYTNEIDLSVLVSGDGPLRPAFFGTSTKGPLNKPTFIANPTEYIDTFGPPTPTNYLGYAVLEFLAEGNGCWVTRIGVEAEPGQEDGIADIAIDTSGANVQGWGRIPLFSGVDYGRINMAAVSPTTPLTFQPASVSAPVYADASGSTTFGTTTATLSVIGAYTGTTSDGYALLITSDPTVSSAEKIGGAGYQIIRNSDGTIVLEGTLGESIRGQSDALVLTGTGLTLVIHVASGVLATNDVFTFTVTPDNRKFQLSVEGVAGSTYTMPTATYTSVAVLVAAINVMLSGEHYEAVSATLSDGTVVPQFITTASGRWIQLVGTAAFATSVGTSQYVYDIPRAFLVGNNDGPYSITTSNNRVVLNVIGATVTKQVAFTIPTGLGLSAAQVAAYIEPNGVQAGDYLFDCYAISTPGGQSKVVIIVSLNHEFDTLQMLASWSNLASLRFAELIGVPYPYQKSYRGFTDGRTSLPAGSLTDPSTPLSCESESNASACLADQAYYANIVGFLVATSPGSWSDGYTADVQLFTQGVGEVAGRYVVTIKDATGAPVDVLQDVSFDATAARYIGNIVNPGSSLGGTNGNDFYNWEPRPTYLNFDPIADDYEVRLPSTFINSAFVGGEDGVPTDPSLSSFLDAALIGNPALSTGIFAIQNPETYDINLLITPGFSSGAVIGQALQICESRGDVLYIVDPPFGLRPQQVVDWHNGMLLSDLTAAINSSYGALYWSWVQIFDQFSSQNVWIPPSGPVSAVFARTAKVAELWSAPAGINRGQLLTALNVEYTPSQPERDLLYGSGNAVNPLVNFPQNGIIVFGQRTLQRTASALDRVNVRMLLIYLKKNLTVSLRQFLFEPNDEILWSQVTNTVQPFLADVQSRRGLNGFMVVCDATNNTPERQGRNELWVSIFIKPTLTVEFIVLNLVVLRQDASFSSSEVLAAGGIVGLNQ